VLEVTKLNDLKPLPITEFYLYQSKPHRQYEPLTAYSLSGKILRKFIEFNASLSQCKKWEHFSHDADIGVRGWGKTINEAFEMAATALTGVIADVKNINAAQSVTISCSAPDIEILFVDWLNTIIYHIETQSMLFSQFQVEIKDLQLNAILTGELIDREKHRPAVDVKGATFTELKVQQQNDLWVAQCVLDV
jgi:SHS2 domain-containing protein